MKKGLTRRRKLIIGILLLYVGAYLFGQYVTIPLTHRNDAASITEQLSGSCDGNVAVADELPVAPTEMLPVSNLAKGAAENGEKQMVSFFLSDLQYLDPQETIDMLKTCKVSAMTVPLTWNVLEKERGNFDPSIYDEMLKPYVDAGFSFIFLVDGANRPIHNTAENRIDGYSLPNWLTENSLVIRQRDFVGKVDASYGWSYASESSQNLYLDFARKVIDHFSTKYAGRVVGFAPGIQSEFEVKYNQTGYCWTDYSTPAIEQFRVFLSEKYGTIEQMNAYLGTDYIDFSMVNPPIINYNNTLMNGMLNDDPLFYDFQLYREKEVVECLIPFYNLVHEKGEKTVSYFGQLLSPQDAIYAAGIGTKLGAYVDIAVIDFNFYNGYDLQFDSIIPAMMVNYMNTAGYNEIWAGLYMERINEVGKQIDFFKETIDYISSDGIADGIEIGGLLEELRKEGKKNVSRLSYSLTERQQEPKIAICTGEWIFYKSHGEDISCYNYFIDSIAQMYKIVRFELGYPVDILCDDAVLNGKLSQYDLLILPAQMYVEPEVRTCVEDYIAGGGKAIQDFRYGEFDAMGSIVDSWSDAYFNIGGREAKCEEINLTAVDPNTVPGANVIQIKKYYPKIANAYSIASSDGSCNYLYQDETGKYYGLYTDSTVVLCFQPQIMYKYAESDEERAGCVAIMKNVIELMLGGNVEQ